MFIDNAYLPTTSAINTNPHGTQPALPRKRLTGADSAQLATPLMSADACGLSSGYGSVSTLTL